MKVNIGNLEVGKVYKNYKAMCEALGVKVEAGNSKKSQIKEWERFFYYSKQGNKFIIEEIYEEPLDKVENRGGANNQLKHAQKLDDTLMHLLDNEEDKVLFLTINRLLLKMNMVNVNFAYGNRFKEKVSNYLDIEEAFIEEFFNATKRTLHSNIESMLNRLKNRALINWHTVKMICVAETHVKTTELGDIKVDSHVTYDEYNNEQIKLSVTTNPTLVYRIATDEEDGLISEVEGIVLDELKCKSKRDVVVKEKWKVFMKKVNTILFERANIVFHYDSYKIIRNEDRLAREVKNADPCLTEEEVYHCLDMLNLNYDVQSQLLSNWERRRNNTYLDALCGDINTKYKFRLSEDYMENGRVLIDKFINSHHKDFTGDLKKIKVAM